MLFYFKVTFGSRRPVKVPEFGIVLFFVFLFKKPILRRIHSLIEMCSMTGGGRHDLEALNLPFPYALKASGKSIVTHAINNVMSTLRLFARVGAFHLHTWTLDRALF